MVIRKVAEKVKVEKEVAKANAFVMLFEILGVATEGTPVTLGMKVVVAGDVAGVAALVAVVVVAWACRLQDMDIHLQDTVIHLWDMALLRLGMAIRLLDTVIRLHMVIHRQDMVIHHQNMGTHLLQNISIHLQQDMRIHLQQDMVIQHQQVTATRIRAIASCRQDAQEALHHLEDQDLALHLDLDLHMQHHRHWHRFQGLDQQGLLLCHPVGSSTPTLQARGLTLSTGRLAIQLGIRLQQRTSRRAVLCRRRHLQDRLLQVACPRAGSRQTIPKAANHIISTALLGLQAGRRRSDLTRACRRCALYKRSRWQETR